MNAAMPPGHNDSLRPSRNQDFPSLPTDSKPKNICIIGTGGFGSRIAAKIAAETPMPNNDGILGTEFFSVDTDETALPALTAKGTPITGLHLFFLIHGSCEGIPELGRIVGRKYKKMLLGKFSEDLPYGLLHTDSTALYIVLTGLGGGAGTGLAQFICKQTKKLGIPTIAIASMPRSNKLTIHKELRRLKNAAHSTFVIDAKDLQSGIRTFHYYDQMARAEDQLVECARHLIKTITTQGLIGLDFNDLDDYIKNSSRQYYGYGYGYNNPDEDAKDAVNRALKQNTSIAFGTRHFKNGKVFIAFSGNTESIRMSSIEAGINELQCRLGKEVDYLCSANITDSESIGIRVDIWLFQ